VRGIYFSLRPAGLAFASLIGISGFYTARQYLCPACDFAVLSVDADDFTVFHEERNPDLEPGLQLRHLGRATRGSIPSKPGFRGSNGQFHILRKLHRYGLSVVF